nr:unnamed protein product [Callosobruchus analis]
MILLDSAHALFVRATYLVCHRLISSWKTDLNISLAALELLSGLARIHIKGSDAMECRRAVKWLCDYIVSQCSRPPPAHSKDLHSTIVAAFQCCSVWLLEHPYLLKDKDCLTTVLEVAELGISGAKSVGKPGEPIKMKEEKELKPASMRVRDAAEHLLSCVLEQVSYFPSECGPESISSLLDELSLLKHCNTWPTDCSDQSVAVERFRYFVTEGSVMLALLEEPLGNDQLMGRQAAVEASIAQTQHSSTQPECIPPPVCHEFQTARLFLSHFGLLSLDETQTNAQDIVGNTLLENVISPYFWEFIHSLGWPVDVSKHPGWTGHISTSWRVSGSIEKNTTPKQKRYDGSSHVLYWADACSEIAFIIPAQVKPRDPSVEHPSFNTSSLSYWSEKSWSDVKDKRTLSLDLDKQPVPPKRATHRDLLNCMDTGLEKEVPKTSDVLVIYLHLLSTGLFRIHLQGPTGRVGLASPLVDGMVVSRRSLGPLVRYTTLNMARRRRLDSDR